MSTSTAFLELNESDITQALCDVLVPRLKKSILSHAPGHCMRVTNLDLDLMVSLSRVLHIECPDAQIYILKENGDTSYTSESRLFISSTKLVELRNPLPNGELRPPLLVFLPANLQASAEDSFGIATFEDIPVSDVYTNLREQLLLEVPPPLQGYITELLDIPQNEWWPWADQVAQVRFLLTTVKNKVDGESLGASLYELGLVPDLRLFDDPALMQIRIRRNLEAVRKLTYSDASIRGRVLELGLSEKVLQQRLILFLTEVGVVDPHVWTRQIIINKVNIANSFDKWQFIDEMNSDKIALQVVNLALRPVGEQEEDKQVEDLSGQKVLNPNLQTKFNIVFNVDPHPTRVTSLDHFTVQILTKDNEPVGGAKRVKTWTTKKTEKTVSLDKLNKLDFEDGWHFVRVLPWTKDDEPIPLEEPSRDLHDNRVKPNESEPFYVLREGEIVDPPPRAVPQESSFEHAKIRTQFKELKEQRDPDLSKKMQIEWIDKASKSRHSQQETIEVRFEHGSRFHIPISRHLKTLERAILTEPHGAMHWSWHVSMRATHNDGPIADSTSWPKSAAVESFLDARTNYFEAICSCLPGRETIIQTIDLVQVYNQSIEYAEAYRDLLTDLARKIEQSRGADQQKAILALRTIIAIDTVRITLTDFRGRTKEAVLVGPTHPLRALWFTTWSNVAQQWLQATKDCPEYIEPVRDGLLHSLVPLNIPATLPNTDGRIFIMVDNINPFWSLYAPSMEEDTRGLLGEVCAILGLPEPAIGGETISVDSIAARIARYLVQHPYIRTLIINAFNPGRAEVLARALVHLQKQEAFSFLHYDVRLFVPDPAAPYVGEAIEALLAPGSGMSTEAMDIFSTPGNSHLFPKLSLAIHSLDDFYHKPHAHRSHLTMLFDLFPAEEVEAGQAFSKLETMPLYGLIQDFTTRFQDSEAGTFWQRQPQHGQAHALQGTEASVELLADVSNLLSGMVATIATGNAAFELRPIITMSLTTAQRELIHYVHEVSDWVLTIDRNIGIEFFDHGWQDERPEYLIDYIPGSSTGSGHRLITTSRVLLELKSTLQPVLTRHLLTSGNRETSLILNQLRALSGRLALKLISSSTHQTEALGLALTRLFLLQQGALSNQIILPLDTHLDLFYSAKRASEEIGEAVTLQRTDLALFDLDATTRTIRCNLVEVKCYSDVGSVRMYSQLKDNIAEQLDKSQEVLRYHFDPHLKRPDRPDRLLKTREFAILLAFYLGRSQRYKLMRKDVDTEAQFFLATLENGYTLHFTLSALIFDFEKMGTELVDTERGIKFYRIGKDQIDALIADYSSRSFSDEMGKAPISSSSSSLPSASFLAPERDHSVPWEREEYREPDNEELIEAQATIPLPHDQSESVGDNMPANDVEMLTQNAAIPLHDLEQKGMVREESIVYQSNRSKDIEQEQLVPEAKTQTKNAPVYDVMLGVQGSTPQYGIFGEIAGRKIALDLNQTHTISLFGVQGSGKSYTLGSIVEMACLPIPSISVLPSPLATVIFHYSPTQDYKPEFTSMVAPNSDTNQIAQLRERYGAVPQALKDMVLLVPSAKVEERKIEYPGIEVLPITFAATELKAVHWRFLMNAVGSQSMYIRQINLIMKKLRDKLTLETLLQEVENSSMSEHLKDLAQLRLQFAAEYVDDNRRLTDVIRPGRLIIVDIRDEFIEKDEALGLFVVLLQIFSEAIYQGKTFNKLVVFDEAHKYMENQDLVSGLIEVVREMRHKGTSIMVASQDPPSVPISLIELSSQIILHRCNSPAWLKHIQKANSSLNSLTPEKMSHLGSGEAYVWSAKATDDGFTRGAIKMKCRPRVTQHGGDTKTAVNKAGNDI